MDVCLRVLKESNKSRFDSYSVWNSVLIISHITFRDCRVHIFSDNLSQNSCIQNRPLGTTLQNIYDYLVVNHFSRFPMQKDYDARLY